MIDKQRLAVSLYRQLVRGIPRRGIPGSIEPSDPGRKSEFVDIVWFDSTSGTHRPARLTIDLDP